MSNRHLAQIEEQMRRKGIKPTASVHDLACEEIFESDEELDEFLAEVREWRRDYHGPIKKALEEHVAVEVVSLYGKAVIIPADEYAALVEGAYLMRSPANALRLSTAYENAIDRTAPAEPESIGPR